MKTLLAYFNKPMSYDTQRQLEALKEDYNPAEVVALDQDYTDDRSYRILMEAARAEHYDKVMLLAPQRLAEAIDEGLHDDYSHWFEEITVVPSIGGRFREADATTTYPMQQVYDLLNAFANQLLAKNPGLDQNTLYKSLKAQADKFPAIPQALGGGQTYQASLLNIANSMVDSHTPYYPAEAGIAAKSIDQLSGVQIQTPSWQAIKPTQAAAASNGDAKADAQTDDDAETDLGESGIDPNLKPVVYDIMPINLPVKGAAGILKTMLSQNSIWLMPSYSNSYSTNKSVGMVLPVTMCQKLWCQLLPSSESAIVKKTALTELRLGSDADIQNSIRILIAEQNRNADTKKHPFNIQMPSTLQGLLSGWTTSLQTSLKAVGLEMQSEFVKSPVDNWPQTTTAKTALALIEEIITSIKKQEGSSDFDQYQLKIHEMEQLQQQISANKPTASKPADKQPAAGANEDQQPADASKPGAKPGEQPAPQPTAEQQKQMDQLKKEIEDLKAKLNIKELDSKYGWVVNVVIAVQAAMSMKGYSSDGTTKDPDALKILTAWITPEDRQAWAAAVDQLGLGLIQQISNVVKKAADEAKSYKDEEKKLQDMDDRQKAYMQILTHPKFKELVNNFDPQQ